ncbi:hypothetical protein [Pseudoalteromonas sp.]|uniref:hypothetical protein n=1 Tax=Pseudoalteromonas sp. TaxID=53249 RepID=UPI00272ADC37|nr:hypothetical protein [Pseudoalteromonas sp.]
MSHLYPTFTPKAVESLLLLQKILLKDPEAITNPECPYDNKIKHCLNTLLVIGATRSDPENLKKLNQQMDSTTKPNAETESIDLDQDIDIETESKRLYNQIRHKTQNLKGLEMNEQLQLFKTATSLLEKLLAVNEKSSNLDKFDAFKIYMIQSMDRYLTPAQKTDFVDELERVLNGDY